MGGLQDFQLRELSPELLAEHFTDRILGLKVSRVDQIEAQDGGILELVVFEIGGDKGIAARRCHLIQEVPAGAAAHSHPMNSFAARGISQAGAGQTRLDKGCKFRQPCLPDLSDPNQAGSLSVLQDLNIM